MSDDWRVHAALDSEIGAGHLLKGMHEREIAHELEDRLAGAGRMPVTADGADVFVYAPDRAHVEAAAEAVRAVLAERGLAGDVQVAQWHPVEEAWKAPDEPLPSTPEQEAAERAARTDREAHESAERGAQWEVRIDFESAAEADRAGDRLEAEGLVPLRRWRHVFLSEPTEAAAEQLAERVRSEDLGAQAVTVEGTAADAWRATHPYAVLGGLGG